MTNPDPHFHAPLREHLAELRLAQIAEIYPFSIGFGVNGLAPCGLT